MVVNGRAKQVTEPLVQLLDQIVQSGDLFVSRSLDEGRDIARIIVERGYPTVLTGGGDGTFVQMVSWIAKLADARGRPLPRFGLLKLGTGNAMAWVLGAQYKKGRGVVADLARLRSEGGSRELRLIEVEGLLTPFGGLGADAITLEYHSQIRDLFQRTPVLKHASHAALTYSVAIAGRTMPQFLMGKAPRFRIYNAGASAYRVSHDNNPADAERYESGALLYDGPATLLAFSTIPYWGLGARIFPFCEDREDRFNLRVASFGSVVALTHLKSIWQGTYRGKRLQDFLVDAIRIECDRPTPLQIGGDVVGMRESVEARLSPRPIRVVDFYSPPPV
ncbi:MAG: diacylglycerol kinase family protein [Myxococcales bacterium]|nr:diacylglycerol kinase family protein [Myxococcales bacterium]